MHPLIGKTFTDPLFHVRLNLCDCPKMKPLWRRRVGIIKDELSITPLGVGLFLSKTSTPLSLNAYVKYGENDFQLIQVLEDKI